METRFQEENKEELDWEFDDYDYDYGRPTIFAPLDDQQRRPFKVSSLLVYALAYFYAASLINGHTIYYLPIAGSLIALTEFLARRLQAPDILSDPPKASQPETLLFLILTLVQALALAIWGLHRQLEVFQFLTIHLTLGFYILSRTGWLSQGRLGIMVWFDTIQAFLLLPFKHFIASFQAFYPSTLTDYEETAEEEISKKIQHMAMFLASIIAAVLLVVFVWSQLSQVSDSFASFFRLTAELVEDLAQLLFSSMDFETILIQLLLAFPIALYLYGLIAGSLLGQKDKILSYQAFQDRLQPLRVFPAFAAYIIIGSLCLTYALFFLTGLTELGNLLSAGSVSQAISPQDASSVAVAGFWQLVRVSLLNFAVLGAFYLLAKKPLWDQKGTRLATTLLFIFASLLALLAGWKLFGIYIFLYGPTPLRLLSGWFVLVLLVWCLLTLVRLYKPIQAIRIGIFYALTSFTLLCYLYPLLLANFRP